MTAISQFSGQHVQYADLNAKQQEIFNFQKVSAILADYGYCCIKLSDDWKGADFLADSFGGEHTLRVQLKGCLTIAKKFMSKGIHMTFPIHGTWYLVDHDELVELVLSNSNVGNTNTWIDKGLWFNRTPSVKMLKLLEGYALRAAAVQVTTSKGAKAGVTTGAAAGAFFVRVGRDILGPFSQTQAAITAVTAAGDLDLVRMDDLQKVVGAAALRPLAGTFSGRDLWPALIREHGLDEQKVKQWAVDRPIYREGQTWVLQTNVWSKARMAKLANLAALTDGAIEIVFDEPSDESVTD